MRLSFTLLSLTAISQVGCQPTAEPVVPSAVAAPVPPPASAEEQALYALGALLGKNVTDLHLSPSEMEQVKQGLGDQGLGLPLKVDMAVAGPRAEQLGLARRTADILARASVQKQHDAPFLQAAAAETGARKLEGGAVIKTISEGSGASPRPGDRMRLAYEAKLTDGSVFDSTDKRGGAVPVSMNEVIACWREGLQTMKVGETAQLVCPSELAYGDRGKPPMVPGGATVVIHLHLLELNPPEPPPPPPRHGPGPRPEPSEDKK